MSQDEKIIQLFFDRNEQAISLLSETYGTACVRVAENILKNPDDARECVNDSYLAIWNKIPPEKPSPLKAYLLRIVRNISIAKYHSNTALKRNSFYDTALNELENCLASLSTPEQEITAQELAREINTFLGTLDEENRVMFVRRYWYGDSVSRIGEMFSLKENTVSVRLSRLRNRLKNHLLKEGFEL